MKNLWKDNRAVIIVCLIFLSFSLGAFVSTQNTNREMKELTDESIEREYQNSLAGCERGNILREQIFLAVSIAAESAENRQEDYQKIINDIKSAPTADPNTGRLDCSDPRVTRPPSKR